MPVKRPRLNQVFLSLAGSVVKMLTAQNRLHLRVCLEPAIRAAPQKRPRAQKPQTDNKHIVITMANL